MTGKTVDNYEFTFHDTQMDIPAFFSPIIGVQIRALQIAIQAQQITPHFVVTHRILEGEHKLSTLDQMFKQAQFKKYMSNEAVFWPK